LQPKPVSFYGPVGSADEFCKRGIASRHIRKKVLMP